jgi:hypothetical protein
MHYTIVRDMTCDNKNDDVSGSNIYKYDMKIINK